VTTVAKDGAVVREAQDQHAAAREISLRLLTQRARSRRELADALRRRGIPDEVGQPLLDRLAQVGLVDDVALAQTLARGYTAKGLAPPAAAARLRQRGLDDADVARALAEQRAEDSAAAARAFAAKRLTRMAGLPPEVQARRLVAQLGRRGYRPEAAVRAVREVMSAAGGQDILDRLEDD
jgi:regulatory protein